MMEDNPGSRILKTRREFLATSACGLGGIALGSLLSDDEVIAAPAEGGSSRRPHREPKAKACIFIFMAGAPSQLDLFDPKPRLNDLHGQRLPDSLLRSARFAFIQPESAVLMGTRRTFRRHGRCGMEFSDLLPHIGSCADDLLMVLSTVAEYDLGWNTAAWMFGDGGRPIPGFALAGAIGRTSDRSRVRLRRCPTTPSALAVQCPGSSPLPPPSDCRATSGTAVRFEARPNHLGGPQQSQVEASSWQGLAVGAEVLRGRQRGMDTTTEE